MEEKERNKVKQYEKTAFNLLDTKLFYHNLKERYPRCADMLTELEEIMDKMIDTACIKRYELVGK